MAIGIKAVQNARKEAALKRPFPQITHSSEEVAGTRVDACVEIIDSDRLAHEVGRVSVSVSGNAPRRADPGADDSRLKAERFAARATYLSEALAPVEADAAGATVARSTPDTMAERGAPYFEARVTNREVTLERFQSEPAGGRRRIGFCLTDETLERLVNDAAAALAPNRFDRRAKKPR